MTVAALSPAVIADMVDHAILKPELTRSEVDAELDTAVRYRVLGVCVRPCDVGHAVHRLAGTGVVVGTVIGFPHGTASTAAKVAEVGRAVADGATELDTTLNLGWLRSGAVDEAEADVRAVVDAARGRLVKVILEVALLSDEEIVTGCRVAERAAAAFVKTSTGFADGGATVRQVDLMRRTVGTSMQVKASGGVRDLDAVLAFHAAGATRIGTSSTVAILDDAAARAAQRASPTGTG